MLEVSSLLKSVQEHLKREDPAQALAEVRSYLATNSLSLTTLAVVDRLVASIARHPKAAATTQVRRVAVLCGKLSPAMLIRAIRCSLAAQGCAAVVHEGNYDGYQADTLDAGSELYAFKPDLIVLALGWRDVPQIETLPGAAEDLQALVSAEVAKYQQVWAVLNKHTGAPVIQHLFDRPDTLLLGVAERQSPLSPWNYLETLNRALIEAAPGFVSWLDMDALALRVGLSAWHSPREYFRSKMPFAPALTPHYLTAFRAAYRTISSKPLKALVLDLDNTLWGGVIGDDGLDGVRFGEGTPEGEAFLAFCRYLRSLRERGIVLAVCSKNDPALPRRMFSERRDMPLKLDHFASFRCNWEDKASNIRAIARELNLGLDALAFVDDNPAECALVSRELPEVTVVALPEAPADFVVHVDGLHLFDQQRITETDVLRAASYQALRAAEELKSSATDIGSFLAGLDMRGDMHRAKPGEIARLAQMEGKTNQFNVTTRRHRADSLEELARRNDAVVASFSLEDKLARHGLVGSLVAVRDGDALRVDSWLLSCRVFSRGSEQFMMSWLVKEARGLGLDQIRGEYLPTDRNDVVADLYKRLGFTSEDEAGRWWSLQLSAADESCLASFIQPVDAEPLPQATAA